ncbi:huntingtin-interacting protein 1-related protein-like [Myxocyprinus asiaticus]|uniref:huntingtin-interacting protein 1-related protein-like n=1 Tax=Myxocyprinus asiaticus TaxID=70543 RepID=UPI002221A57B|nr:huntingtin-interacting protein 1-related protein-like [Myxocyprinus asiaticus]XP_051539907.1 huntingtin-interacting protein 1-related protein-like [Myxocyprinus asiaticus]
MNDMAAVVVTSTKAGQMQIEEKNSMDFSVMSLIKIKTEEMDFQVRGVRLGELRKRHYDMGGIPMASSSDKAMDNFDSSLPTHYPDLPTMEPPSLEPFRLDPPRLKPPTPEPTKSSKQTSISSYFFNFNFFHKSGSIFKNAFR